MATKVFMEALSPTMEEGRLVKWLRSEGDAVKRGDVLAEVETDKAVMELVARGEGVLRARVVGEGATAPVGALVGVIGAAGEDIAAIVAGASVAAGAKPLQPPPQPPPMAATVAGAAEGGRTIASPLARRLAGERGLDLSRVAGSGPGGRVIKRDIEAAVAAGGSPPPSPVRRPPASGAEFEDVPLTQIRKTIARRLVESIGPVPTFYLTAEFDVTRAAELRSAMGEEFKVSFNDVMLKATATALSQHPEVNAHWLGDHVRFWYRVHLGMAVATDDGLIVPVIHDADAKRLGEISAEARKLAARARARRLKPEEYTGSTFSVSNLGMMEIEQFTAIINPPEAGILAIGAIEERPVVVEGTIQVRKRLRVTMSCDHRVVDGAAGARFLQTLRRMIENPLMLVY
ncbi:MAG TPA: dihydrolipoamide acetyltransferase family protein [Gemmatimonadaceae bacterium]|nr:dihydrolipoamide acetyltransferase family protein [Gemmatimonadaceae bacterium]